MGSDYWFSLRDLSVPTSEMGWNGNRPLNREGLEKRNRQGQGGRNHHPMRPPWLCSLFLFGLAPLFPLRKFPLPLFALVESENVGQDTAGDGLDLVLGNVGVVDWFLLLTQILSSKFLIQNCEDTSHLPFVYFVKLITLSCADRPPPSLCRKIVYRRNENLKRFSHTCMSKNIVSDFGCHVKSDAGKKCNAMGHNGLSCQRGHLGIFSPCATTLSSRPSVGGGIIGLGTAETRF